MGPRHFERAFLVALAVSTGPAAAQPAKPAVPEAWAGGLARLEWRVIGPAAMQGRVADVEGVPGNPAIVYVGAASGGVWKTVNAGTAWTPVFDAQPVQSIGDIALDPTNPEVVYVGTGEANTRNSVSFGDGVYKSTDGGRSWTNVGLRDSEHVARIVVDPRDPRRVFVAALGHVYGANPERGVFLSSDGGLSWQKVLYLDDEHGAADLDVDPQNPNVVFATMWRFRRWPWKFESGSDKSGLYRSLDGGRSWNKVEAGLPRRVGRMGVKVAPGNPKVVYVAAESDEGTYFRSDDGGTSFKVVSKNANLVGRGFYYADLRVDPKDENRVYAISFGLAVSGDGGREWKPVSRNGHGDYQALWIDPTNPARIWNGDDGGLAVSYDRGEKWTDVVNLPFGQFYQLYADDRQPFYYLGGGLQDNACWYGPSRTREPAGILNGDWKMIVNGDGYYVVAHPDDPDLIIAEYQGGGITRTDMRTREQQDISPQPRRNDGGPAGELPYRFNWSSPIVASPHDGKVVYFAGNVLFRSRDFGASWEPISPDLTTNDPAKTGQAGGPVWKENTTAEYHCTIISVAESPLARGVLWAGTDDGRLQLTRDDGKTWIDRSASLPVPRFSPVSHVEPSRRAAGTAYVAFDRHMFDDFRPHLFRTTDFGETWVSLGAGLPAKGYVHVVREDPRNPNLIYVGTELGLYASWSGGRDFARLHLKNLPSVAVHDILVHPRQNDLILGTHGRSLMIFDDATPLQAMTSEIAATRAHLFPARPALRHTLRDTTYGLGDGVFRGQNPPYGAILSYWLKDAPAPELPLKLEILHDGQVVREIRRPKRRAGINRVAWDLALEPATPRKPPEPEKPGEDDDKEPEPPLFETPPELGPPALPGRYAARLTVGTQSVETPLEVRLDPTLAVPEGALARQHEAARELTALRSSLNLALRRLDEVQLQLEERRKLAASRGAKDAVRQALLALAAATRARIDALVKPEDRPFYSEGPRVTDRVRDLQAAIQGVHAAPTPAQAAHLEELRGEAARELAETRRFLGAGLADTNRLLRDAGLPEIGVVQP